MSSFFIFKKRLIRGFTIKKLNDYKWQGIEQVNRIMDSANLHLNTGQIAYKIGVERKSFVCHLSEINAILSSSSCGVDVGRSTATGGKLKKSNESSMGINAHSH